MPLQVDQSNKGSAYDFQAFLSNYPTSIPKASQWAVQFLNLNSISNAINLAIKQEPNSVWNVAAAIDEAARLGETSKGCMFCTAISLPGDGTNTAPEGIKTNNFLRSSVGTGRQDFPDMRMSFIDTHLSFTDSLLRGWSLATATFGMIARDGEKNYRTDMTCWKYGITSEGPVALQKITFRGLCCISVSDEEMNYDVSNNFVRREARFSYHSYAVEMPQ